MGIVVLAIISAIELALMTFSLVTQSRQEKIRGVVHIISFAAFVIFVAVSVIPWSFRWFGLATLLFFLAVLALWNLFLKPRWHIAEYKSGAIIFRALAILFLAFISLSPGLIFPPYHPLTVTGQYQVATARFTYTDENRIEAFSTSGENRQVNAVFWYPQEGDNAEIFPLVVFSHGGLGLETSNESLYHELASHGYVVCSVGHPYHAFWTRGEDGGITLVSWAYFRELQEENPQRDMQQSFRYYQKWMETRLGDINFVINTIVGNASNSASGVYALVDVERIGVMGHSLGGSAALALPRLRDDIDAVIALESPFLFDIAGVEGDQFVWTDQVYPVPVLNVYSDSAWEHLADWPQYSRNYALLTDAPATAYNLYFPGRGHFSLTDLSLTSPFLVRLLEGGQATRDPAAYLRDVNQACLEFFNHHLKD